MCFCDYILNASLKQFLDEAHKRGVMTYLIRPTGEHHLSGSPYAFWWTFRP